MKHLSKITVAGALLFTLTSTAYAQSSMSNGSQNSMGNQPAAPSSTDTQNVMSTSSPGVQTNTPQVSTGSTMAQPSHNPQAKNMPITFTPDSIQWKDTPNMFPPGAQLAVLEGNPKTKGSVTIRIKFPANYQLPPVYIQSIERVTVLSGNINVGMGDKFDTNAGIALPAGSFTIIPARKHHYLWTSEESVIQINGMGPWSFKYVNSKDDPRKNTRTGSQQAQSQNQPAASQQGNPTSQPTQQQ